MAPPALRRPAVALVAIALLAAGLRFATLAAVFPPRLTGDELYYVDTAIHLARGEGHYSEMFRTSAGWPPAHAFLLSRFLSPAADESYRNLAPSTLATMLRVEVVVSTALAVAIALLGTSLFDPRTGALAGLFAAVYPTFVAYSHFLWSETLFLALLVAALALAAWAVRTGSLVGVATAGALFGAATLAREIGGLVAGCVAVWWVATGFPSEHASDLTRARRIALARGALLLVCVGLVVAPWTIRNTLRFERLVPVSTVGWMGVREGNTFAGPTWLRPHLPALQEFRARYFALDSEIARMELARREAWSLIRSEQPLWLAKKLVRNGALLFSPDSFLFKKISRGSYGHSSRWIVRALLVATVTSYLAIAVLGIVGIAACDPPKRLLALLLATVVVGLHVFAHASSRYRLPLVPIAMVYGAWAVLHRDRIAALSPAARLACCAAVLAGLVWPLVYFAGDAVSLWQVGTYQIPGRP